MRVSVIARAWRVKLLSCVTVRLSKNWAKRGRRPGGGGGHEAEAEDEDEDEDEHEHEHEDEDEHEHEANLRPEPEDEHEPEPEHRHPPGGRSLVVGGKVGPKSCPRGFPGAEFRSRRCPTWPA